jgi:hypothetical protein
MASYGPIAMTEPDFGAFADETDDLPRTLRREKEARARQARERAAMERAAAPSLSAGDDDYGRPQPRIYRSADDGENAIPATVRAFNVPFVHLAMFFMKAVLAAIPALLLLGAILWFLGSGLEALFPQLVKMKILIGFQG